MRKIVASVIMLFYLAACAVSSPPTNEVGAQDPTAAADTGRAVDEPTGAWEVSQWAEITLENVAHLEELAILEGHARGVAFVVVNPASTILVSSSDEGRIRVWDLKSGNEIATLVHGPQTVGIAINPEGNQLVSGATDRSVRIWDLDTATQIREFNELPWAIVIVDWSPDGTLVAASARDHIVRVWHVDSGELLHQLVGHVDDVYSVEFDPRSDTLATGSLDGSVMIWDLGDGETQQYFKASDEGVFYAAFSPDGSRFAACGGGLVGRDNSVRIFDSTSWEAESKLNGFDTTVVSCFFSADGRLLFTRTFGGELWIWDMLSQEVVAELEVPSSWLPAMALDPGGQFLAVGDPEGVIHIYGVRP
ncbi:MAG: WD40 repeat domain-containing protein [Anaerolineales bacterium]|jgi:WD40 repeat protein